MTEFDLISEITDIETIAVGSDIREIDRIRRQFGSDRWRKLKGFATIQLFNGVVWFAEVHWYEAHGLALI